VEFYPRPRWGSLQCSPGPELDLREPNSNGMGWEERKGAMIGRGGKRKKKSVVDSKKSLK